MFGLINKMSAAAGQRAALADILAAGTKDMPGCISYVIAADASDETTLWITEVWDSAQAHKDSLQLPAVQAAIAKGRPLIAGMENIATTQPLS